MRQFFIFTALILAMSAFSFSSARSQTPAPAPEATAPVVTKQEPTEAELVKFNQDKYVDPTISNLAHLYWAMGMLDPDNNKAIDNFLALTDCKMYETYRSNDLEWKEIRETTKKFLQENYKVFPTHFKITIPLYLGNYNTEEEYFEINQDESAINSVRNIDTIYNTNRINCGMPGNIENYPRNLILYLNRPFMLPELPVERELARLFLDELNEKTAQQTARRMDNPDKVRSDNLRMAYLQLMFRVHSYRETKNTMGGERKAVVYTQIDYIKVFADMEGEKLLYQKDMYEDTNRKRRKRLDAMTEEDLKLPSGPIFGDPKKKQQ